MKQRLLTAAILVILLVPPIFLEIGWPLILLGAVIITIASYEYKQLSKNNIIYIPINLGVYFSITLLYNDVATLIYIKVLATLLLLYSFYLVIKNAKIHEWIHPIFNVIYIGVGAASLVSAKLVDVNYLLFLLLIIIFTDVFAFVFGIRYGKHRLAPLISPKKSIEGSVAGTILGTLIGVIFANIVGLDFSSIELILLGLSLSIVGQFGDLFASKVKRHYGVKDFGSIFPGHGGVLDRFDSMLLAAMVLLLVIL